MKKSAKSLLVLLSVFVSVAVTYGVAVGTVNLSGEYISEDGIPSSGIKREYYPTGELAAEYVYRNGKLNGVSRKYFISGDLKQDLPYKNGKLEGLAKEYFQDGLLFVEEPYKNGTRDGTAREYFPGFGRLKYEYTYRDGKKEGVAREYKVSGRLYRKVIFKDDVAVSGVYFPEDGIKRKMTHAHLYNLFEMKRSGGGSAQRW